jgi:subtilisin family serine protease
MKSIMDFHFVGPPQAVGEPVASNLRPQVGKVKGHLEGQGATTAIVATIVTSDHNLNGGNRRGAGVPAMNFSCAERQRHRDGFTK